MDAALRLCLEIGRHRTTPRFEWVVEHHPDAADPVAAAWHASASPGDMADLLNLLGAPPERAVALALAAAAEAAAVLPARDQARVAEVLAAARAPRIGSRLVARLHNYGAPPPPFPQTPSGEAVRSAVYAVRAALWARAAHAAVWMAARVAARDAANALALATCVTRGQPTPIAAHEAGQRVAAAIRAVVPAPTLADLVAARAAPAPTS